MTMMNPEDVETVSFEMGVLLFHGLSQKSEEVASLKTYDVKDNAQYMFRGLESIMDEDLLREGFEHEAKKMNMSKQEMDVLFKQTLKKAREAKQTN